MCVINKLLLTAIDDYLTVFAGERALAREECPGSIIPMINYYSTGKGTM